MRGGIILIYSHKQGYSIRWNEIFSKAKWKKGKYSQFGNLEDVT